MRRLLVALSNAAPFGCSHPAARKGGRVRVNFFFRVYVRGCNTLLRAIRAQGVFAKILHALASANPGATFASLTYPSFVVQGSPSIESRTDSR